MAFRVRHLGLKIVSVVLATLLWLLVSGEQTVERALRIPLQFTNLPPRLELVGDPPEMVDVRLRGSSGTMSRLSSGELAAILDVGTARPGQRLFHLTTADVRAPFGVDVVQVSPASMPLTFEESRTKRVRVVAQVDGEPATGYVISSIVVDPIEVEVVGPAGALSGVGEAITDPVSVAGDSEGRTETVTLGVANPAVRLRQAQNARVTVTITPTPEEWVVDGIPVQVQGPTAGVTVSLSAVTVRVRGPRTPAAHAADVYHASVDTTGLGPGRHQRPIRVDAPEGLAVLRVDPAVATVTIR